MNGQHPIDPWARKSGEVVEPTEAGTNWDMTRAISAHLMGYVWAVGYQTTDLAHHSTYR
jgi:hypothetical protein